MASGGSGGARHCWAPAAAGTGVPSVLVAEMMGDPARGPRGEAVGKAGIPEGGLGRE